MLENTVKRTSKKSGPTTESVANTKIVFKPKCKSQRLGAKKTGAGERRTVLLVGQSDLVRSFDSLVSHVTARPPWPTTMTMTSLSMFGGSVSLATKSTISADAF